MGPDRGETFTLSRREEKMRRFGRGQVKRGRDGEEKPCNYYGIERIFLSLDRPRVLPTLRNPPIGREPFLSFRVAIWNSGESGKKRRGLANYFFFVLERWKGGERKEGI